MPLKTRIHIASLTTRLFSGYCGLVPVVLALAFTTLVRMHLRDMPLERDEGEYAYTAQLLLRGELPYAAAYTMKLPGVSLACALAMLVFGESAEAIRILTWLVNAISILLVFLLGRRLLDAAAGAVAAVCFAFISLSPNVLGLAAHASHFVMMFALLGALLLLRGIDTGRVLTLALSGAMFGLAFIMKQPGLVFGLFGLAYLSINKLIGGRPIGTLFKNAVVFVLGLLAPFALISSLLWFGGAFDKFWFWTFTYAHKYSSALSFEEGMRVFRTMLAEVTVGNLFFAILALLGAGVLWWDARLNPYRLFVIGFTLSSVAALWPGMYFRHHYFVFVAPAVALLAGVAVSRCLYLLGRDLSIELLLTPPTLVLFGAAVIYAAVIHGPVWLASSPTDASKLIYRSSIFADSLEVARFLEQATTPSQKVAVLGSEPQIYFYSRRRAATGHIYMYPLMETHPYAAKMQEELVRELEAAQPEFVVFINMHTSWLRRPESERRIFDWWTAYSKTNYMLVRVFTPTSSTGKWDPEKFLPYLLGDYSIPAQLLVRTVQPNETVPLAIHVYKRRPSAP